MLKVRLRARIRWRRAVAAMVALVCMAAPIAGADVTLLVMEVELEGDTTPNDPAAWADRLDLLASYVIRAIDERGIYDVVDGALAEPSFAKHRHRAGVHSCMPCAVESGREVGAQRVMSLWVFRMSTLILSMQAIIRDTDTGAVRYAIAHDLRGDTDESWLHAADRLVEGLAAIPPDLR